MVKRRFQTCFCGLFLLATSAGLHAFQQPADPLANERALVAAGKFAESRPALLAYIMSNPSSPDAHFLLGYVLFREQKATESIAEFNAGAKLRRPHPDELKIVASDYAILGDFANADRWFTEVVAESPNDVDAHYLLGRTKFNESDFPAAIASFNAALRLRPKYVEAENNIGLAWRELNDFAKAQVAFQTAIDWQGETPVDAQPYLNLGTLLADRDELDKAIPCLTQAAALSPDNPSIHEELSHVYALQQILPKAQSELEKAIALAPAVPSLHYKLAQIFRKQGMQDRARDEFAICSKLSGTHSSEKTPNPISIRSADNR